MSSVRPSWMTASERKPSYFSSKTHSGWSKGAGLRDIGIGWNAMARRYHIQWRKLGELYDIHYPVRAGHKIPDLFQGVLQRHADGYEWAAQRSGRVTGALCLEPHVED